MIVSRIDGGLGNQMFQVAFGMEIAYRNQTELVLDLSSYASGPQHGLLIDRLQIEARALRKDERHQLPVAYDGGASWQDRWLGWNQNRLRRVKEKPFGFRAKYFDAPDNAYLVGYWQSEKYFPSVREQVRKQFQPAPDISSPSRELHARISSSSSVAMHIRRGDYVSNSQAARIYRLLSHAYYLECLHELLAQWNGVTVYVFSNDPAWCREHLELPCPVCFIEYSDTRPAHEDMWLMSSARAIVTANSTFSWWAGWLASRPDAIVYCPAEWFYPGTLSDRDLPCADWQARHDPLAETMSACHPSAG